MAKNLHPEHRIQITEELPGERWRGAVFGRVRHLLAEDGLAVELGARVYADDWGASAFSVDPRVYTWIARDAVRARLRYRYYKQTASFFYEANPNDYTFQDPYVTADPKLSAFHVNEAGIHFLVLGSFLEGRAHRSIAGASFDISFNYRWNTNAFGNQVVAQTGLRIPF